MKRLKQFSLFVCLAALVSLANLSSLMAQSHQAVLNQYLTDDVIAFAVVDLNHLDLEAAAVQLQELGIVESNESPRLKTASKVAAAQVAKLKNAGLRHAYVLLRLEDVAQGAPLFVLPIDKDADTNDAFQQWQVTSKSLPPLKSVAGDNAIFAAASDQQLQHLQDLAKSTKSPAKSDRDLSAAIAAMDEGTLRVVICGDDDSRKVVRDLLPTLPTPFESISGKMLAEDLEWGMIKVDLPPQMQAKMLLKAKSNEAAKNVAKAIEPALEKIGEMPALQSVMPPALNKKLFAALKPEVAEDQVTLSLDQVTSEPKQMAATLFGPLQKARTAAREAQEKNNLRQLGLAMHNYNDVYRMFPRVDGKSEHHPAGLSWRVHLLPYLNQKALYDQFKLDEPWDSPANLKLIKQMPALYRSPLPEYAEANDEGRTSYQVPVGPEAIFHKDKDSETFATITDGTVNTLLIVATNAESAAIWTKPSDWEYDLENPFAGLKSEGRTSIIVSRADGFVEAMPATTPPATLKALITASGSEVLDNQ